MSEEIIEQPKKKRGRPRKENPYREYQQYILEIVETTINDNIKEIQQIFSKDTHITKEEWKYLYELVQNIAKRLYEHNTFNGPLPDDLSKKPDSSYKSIDAVREAQSKKYIIGWVNNTLVNNAHKTYLIYLHIKNYVYESSKTCKV